MAEFLLFQLFGPLAAWGDTAVGEERPSAPAPGKSAVSGLLAAALGIRRHEHDRLSPLWADYHLAVREDSQARLMTDYHTVQDPALGARDRRPVTRREALAHSKVDTVLTLREYLVEGAWVVCWWAAVEAPAYELAELVGALKLPALTLYLGRKSCPPGLPLAPAVVEASSWFDALSHSPRVGDPAWGQDGKSARNVRAFLPDQGIPWLDSPRFRWDGNAETPPALVANVETTRLDMPVHRGRWQFTRRTERVSQPQTALEG